MPIELKIVPNPHTPLGWQVMEHNTEYLSLTARLAVNFTQQVLASADMAKVYSEVVAGENKAWSRAELIAKRSCDLAEALVAEMSRRELLTTLTLAEAEGVYHEARQRDQRSEESIENALAKARAVLAELKEAQQQQEQSSLQQQEQSSFWRRLWGKS